eukprot:CAMPEP_0183341850 /NCGR_PEP_ID=MMETSP0164_2-20130417/8058_1 /TAXON_ID=221442 /ORGANISM="Coccolithus pelagicus ssp braarudi, Strain PLY182g" /LENGTH=147 /DNA_ID=CAMNT_0025512279 /DNA_START=253 /DNA_END=695 /DNA_ORIENTATION=+
MIPPPPIFPGEQPLLVFSRSVRRNVLFLDAATSSSSTPPLQEKASSPAPSCSPRSVSLSVSSPLPPFGPCIPFPPSEHISANAHQSPANQPAVPLPNPSMHTPLSSMSPEWRSAILRCSQGVVQLVNLIVNLSGPHDLQRSEPFAAA